MRRLLDRQAFAVYVAAALVCLGLTYYLLGLWQADFRIPFIYGGGDELPICLWIKGLQDNPWIFHNSRVGMPFGLEMFDYPLPEVLHLLVFKLLGLTTRHFGKVLNLFYIATFPAILLCSLYTFRRLGVSYPSAIFSSFLYTFLPYHFRRGEAHLFLAAYYAVPLILLVAFRFFSNPPPFFRDASRSRGGLLGRLRCDWGVVVICAVLGSTGTGYYAFFSCFLLVTAGAAAAAYRRRFEPALSAFVVIIIVCITVGLNIAPNLLFGRRDTALRPPGDAETYGLKIAQMLLPIGGHRLPAFAEARAQYNNAPLVNENDTVTLGLVGSAGFLLLLGWIGFRVMRPAPAWFSTREHELLDRAALLTLAATLVGTIGGFGSLFAFLVHPQFRSYNRISVFIAFLCLLAVGLLIDRVLGSRLRTTGGRIVHGGLLLFLLACGILDQTSPVGVPDYGAARKRFLQDEAFVHNVEAVVPANSMIFQLPYMQFPETGGSNKMTTYDHVRGYLHSEKLRWSFGAMKGEAGDAWQEAVTTLPLNDMVKALACAGFAGIYVDRFGYVDNGVGLERQLSTAVDEGPIVANGRLLFYSLAQYKTALRAGLSDRDWQALQNRLNPPFIVYEGGFYAAEISPGRVWRWSRGESSLRIFNLSSAAKPLLLDVTIASGYDELSTLRITSPILDKTLKVNREGVHLRERIVLPVGETEVTFRCDAPRLNNPGDLRRLVFGIQNLALEEEFITASSP